MNKRSIKAVLLTAVLVFTAVAAAHAVVTYPNQVTISLSMDPAGDATTPIPQGGTVTLIITADDMNYVTEAGKAVQVAGCALTVDYDETILEVVNGGGELNRITDVLSDAFGMVSDNRTPPGTPTQDYPRIGYDDPAATNKVLKLSGANVGNEGHTGSKALFKVKFKVKSTATAGVHNNAFIVTETTLNNTNAGYNNEAVPVLIGAVASTDAAYNVYDCEANAGNCAFPEVLNTLNLNSNLEISEGTPLPDVTGDGFVNVFDVIKVQRAALGLPVDPPFDADLADVNNDGFINVFDVIKTQRAALGLPID
ncbi:MAG: cohesin domain-containing protein [Desulfococcaceae bacterium]